VNNTVLISLAILKTNWEANRKDYLEMFVPLVAESTRSLSGPFSLSDLQTAFRTEFGLSIPQNVMLSLLRRLKKRGIVVNAGRELYRAQLDEVASRRFRDIRDSVLAAHQNVIEDMVEFVAREYGVRWTNQEAEHQLECYLQDNRLMVTGISESGTLLLGWSQTSKRDRFLVCSYIDSAYSSDPLKFSYIDTVIKGNLLANAVFLPEPAEAQRKFRGTRVFFDSPFLISALGWAGQTRREPCLELLSLLYGTGADLCCFRHTREEIERILYASASRLSDGQPASYGAGIKTDEYFKSAGYGPTDIQILAGQVERRLEQLHISVVDPPEYSRLNMPLDEEALKAFLQEAVGYANPLALDHDLRSLSAVLRLREGREYLRIEECRAVFITANEALCSAGMEFYYRTASLNAISPIITDVTLTNLLWLKKPLKAPDLPRKKVIADCFAAVQPDESLWRRYIAEVEHLKTIGSISSDDYYILRHSREARAEMMRLTLGQDAQFHTGTVSDVLEAIKVKNEKPLREQLELSESQRLSVERQLAAAVEFEKHMRERAASVSARIGKAVYCAVFLSIILFVSIAALFSYVRLPEPWNRIVASAAIFGEFWSISSYIRGTTVRDCARLAQVRAEQVVSKWFLG